ncbi:HD-GYP domain-containing protein [Cupriavidus basilensis]
MVSLGRQLGLSDDEVRDAGLAGLLHDIGKIAIPPEVLNKPGALTDAEFRHVIVHPQAGHDILAGDSSMRRHRARRLPAPPRAHGRHRLSA